MGIGELAMKKCKIRYTFSNESGEFNTFFQANNVRFVTLFQANQAGFDTFFQINNTTKIPWTALGGAVQGIRS